MASASIVALQQKLFGAAKYVCGGHGARWPADQKFKIPRGIKVYFYVHDTESLANDIGQKVDQVLTGGTAPAPTEIFGEGDSCWDYRLFYSKAGGYLNLKMSTGANPNYITTNDKDQGIHLSRIINDLILPKNPVATVYWSACRSEENGTDTFAVDKAEYKGKLAALASKAGKVTL